MAAESLETVRKRAKSLAGELADKSAKLTSDRERDVKKKLRRAQRKRRRLEVAEKRASGAKPEPSAE